MKKLFTLPVAIVALSLMSVVEANTLMYTPPAEIGNIYIVVKFKENPFGIAQKTGININWGGWSKSSTVDKISVQNCELTKNSGFVIKLYHSKKDSYSISATSDGTVVSIAQGNAPSQWSNSCYKQISW